MRILVDSETWGEDLRYARKRLLRMTQGDIADQTGSTRQTIYHLETRKTATLKTFFRYLTAMNCRMVVQNKGGLLSETVNRATLGTSIRKLRKMKDLSQDEVAEAAGVSRMTVHNLEKSSNGKMTTFFSILKFLNSEIIITDEKSNIKLPEPGERLPLDPSDVRHPVDDGLPVGTETGETSGDAGDGGSRGEHPAVNHPGSSPEKSNG